jgi:hypothetical protein
VIKVFLPEYQSLDLSWLTEDNFSGICKYIDALAVYSKCSDSNLIYNQSRLYVGGKPSFKIEASNLIMEL